LLVKSLVLDNGNARLAFALCDLCVTPGHVVTRAKEAIEREAGIPAAHVMIASTHTHSGPATIPLFQSEPDAAYLDWLAVRIADSVRLAARRLEPCRIGMGFGREDRIVFNRRYHMKAGTVNRNPFGGNDLVKTNPGTGNPDVVKPAGPVDPAVGVLAVETHEGRPIAVLANYCLHYVGGVGPAHISADYFAYWAEAMARLAGVSNSIGERPFVPIIMNGWQGNVNNIDVFGPRVSDPPYARMKRVAEILAAECFRTWRTLRYQDSAELGASQEMMEFALRLPTAGEVSAARKLVDSRPAAAVLKDQELVYARETVTLGTDYPKTVTTPIQALRVGDLGIAAFPGEPFVELGLELRAKSPFKGNYLVGLANDHQGYVPTPEALEQGGYETWRAKTSYLEKNASPKLVAALLGRLGSLAD
jgi:hypothetical protein